MFLSIYIYSIKDFYYAFIGNRDYHLNLIYGQVNFYCLKRLIILLVNYTFESYFIMFSNNTFLAIFEMNFKLIFLLKKRHNLIISCLNFLSCP